MVAEDKSDCQLSERDRIASGKPTSRYKASLFEDSEISHRGTVEALGRKIWRAVS